MEIQITIQKIKLKIMTLKEFVINKREAAKFWTKSEDLELSPDQLETMIYDLKQCEEFEDTELKIMNFPAQMKGEGDSVISARTIILHEGTKFGKEAYLYKIHTEQDKIKVRGHFEYYQVPNESQPVKI
jgi:hypothetical protein